MRSAAEKQVSGKKKRLDLNNHFQWLFIWLLERGNDDEILRHALEIFLAKRKRKLFLSLLLRLAAITPSSIFEFVIVQFSESSNPNK
jgi:hypothetical protein